MVPDPVATAPGSDIHVFDVGHWTLDIGLFLR